MIPATTPEKLLEIGAKLKIKGAVGALISGGCDTGGRLWKLPKFLPAIKRLKTEHGLIIKLHTGFVDTELAAKIADSVDVASMEFVGANSTIKEIFGLGADVEDYATTFRNLKAAGMKYIAPHIATGLHYSELRGELNALEILSYEKINPSSLSIIVFRPTKDTELADLPSPRAEDVALVVKKAVELFPQTNIILGALRPRSSARNDMDRHARLNIERAAVDAGIQGMEIPSSAILELLRERNCRLKKIDAFGVLPVGYEERVRCEWL